MRALSCTRHRHAVMSEVLDARIVQVPASGGRQQWMRRTLDLMKLDDVPATPLAPAESKALNDLLAAKLIRTSSAAPRSGRSRGHRMVFATKDGRDWWAKGPRATRGCTNRNSRGNSEGRRRRRQWLIDTYGDGSKADCWLAVPGVCAGPVTFETISVERVQPGHAGGTYRRDNSGPACPPGQSPQGARFARERRRQRAAADQALRDLVDAAACST